MRINKFFENRLRIFRIKKNTRSFNIYFLEVKDVYRNPDVVSGLMIISADRIGARIIRFFLHIM